MKTNLKDVTFLILVRLDSIQRLENIINITDTILKYYDTNIFVLEASPYCNGVLRRILNKNILYQFIEDKDPVLYKTKHFNSIMSNVNTDIVSIWDADIVIDKKAIGEAITSLRDKTAEVAYPYNGKCFDTSEIIRSLYLKKKDIRILYRNINKMDLLYEHLLVGGGVFVGKESYIYAGMEKETHYGWGDDDFDRYYRFARLGLRIYRVNTCLFHLSHPRFTNSKYSSTIQSGISSMERFKTENSSKAEILATLKNSDNFSSV